MKRWLMVGLLLIGCDKKPAPSPTPNPNPNPSPTTTTTTTTTTTPPAPGALLEPTLEADPALPRARGEVRFDWSPPCRVPVVQVIDKQGRNAVLRFVVALSTDGKELALRLEEMRIVELDGKEPTAEEQRQLGAALTAIPTMRVSTAGKWLGTRDMDKTIDFLVREAGVPEEVAANMRSPKMRAMLEAGAAKYWNAWAGAWIGAELGGAPVDKTKPADPASEEAPSRVIYEHIGSVNGHPELALVFLAQSFGGEEATAKGVRKEIHVAAAIEPATARPHRVRVEETLVAQQQSFKEIRDTAFDWSKAMGCGR